MNAPEEVLRSLYVKIVDEPSTVFILAMHLDVEQNYMAEIDCGAGSPISTFVYDSVKNRYNIRCRDYLPLGSVPVSFRLQSNTTPDWRVVVPAPPVVIENYLSTAQLALVKEFKSRHKGSVYSFDYLQFAEY